MIGRYLARSLEQHLNHCPAVALLGPRQVGKTTLALQVTQGRPSVYLDLESPGDLLKLSDPLAFLSQHQDKLIVLDEIQRAPELFTVMRGLIDKKRYRGHKGALFLILGSASIDLLKQSSETLAGRIGYLELGCLNALETQSNTVTRLQKLRLRGGFPESYLAHTERLSTEWRENFIRTYLERDLPQLGFRVPAVRLRRLWTMLAHLQGETINASALAKSLEVDSKTVSHYIDILADLLLIRRLEPWHINTKKRMVKSPRIYIRDTGILHRLLDIADQDGLLSHPINGKSWEGFVIENLLSVIPLDCKPCFYRTTAGAEIDLILRFSSKELWAVEIKTGTAPKIKQFFHKACKDAKATHKFVIYGGNERFTIADDTQITPLSGLMQDISLKK